ncbi:MAG: hypothetical protein OEV42_01310 [Deltaproteobacteria bacterium]|nr:hypothetical protein [Deltaproteobacteria bacterium]
MGIDFEKFDAHNDTTGNDEDSLDLMSAYRFRIIRCLRGARGCSYFSTGKSESATVILKGDK